MPFYRIGAFPFMLWILTSCAAVDQFGERIYDGNRNSQLAQNQETLVNIVRASRLQPLNFVAISQVSGSQTETLNTGLPTVTFGPLQTIAQHQFQVSNSLQSGVVGSYQSAPLVSTAFSTGMLSPLDTRTLAFLLATYPREPVFVSVIESIYIKPKKTGTLIRLVNDPSRDDDDSCKDLIGHPNGRLLTEADRCNFSLFVNYLELLINVGLTAELVKPPSEAKKAAAKGVKADTDAAKPSLQGRLCFDPTRAKSVSFQPQCGDSRTAASIVFRFADIGDAEVSLVLRSPIGVFNYFGKFLNKQPAQWRNFYFSNQARELVGDEPFLNIQREPGAPCFAKIEYVGELFCAPQASRHTALLLTLLLHMRNLNIQPSDLNSAFTVRLSGT